MPSRSVTRFARVLFALLLTAALATPASGQQRYRSAHQTGSGAGTAIEVQPGDAKGTNQAGANTSISPGRGTGNGASGELVFKFHDPNQGSGATLRALENKFACTYLGCSPASGENFSWGASNSGWFESGAKRFAGHEHDDAVTCASGDFVIWADASEGKWKKCDNGVVSDLGAADVTSSSTTTFTNKTIDAEAAGNFIKIPDKLILPAAGCDDTTATTFWDRPADANAPDAACVAGTNVRKGVLDFIDGATNSAQQTLWLPSDWTGNVDVEVKWFSTATSGSVVWQIQTSCVADGETDDPSWNTADTITDAAKGTANQMNDASVSAIAMTGCAAGELWHLLILRDPTHASDHLGATARLYQVALTVRRAM